MKASVLLDNLRDALSIASRAVDRSPILPILGYILVEADAEGSRLNITCSTFDLSISTWLGAKVEVPGRITLPSRTLIDLVKPFSANRVNIELDNETHTAQIRCGTQAVNLRGISADEFPPITHYNQQVSEGEDPIASFTIWGAVLREMIQQTSFAAAKDEIRPVLAGIYVCAEDNELTMAASDGYRLAVRTATLESPIPKQEFIIPVSSMVALTRIIQDGEHDVVVGLSNKHHAVTFATQKSLLTSQLVDGRFPDYKAIFPKSHATSMVADREEFMRICQLASVFSQDNANNTELHLSVADNGNIPSSLAIKGKSAQRGSSEGLLGVRAEGDNVEVSFNVKYLIEGVGMMKSEDVMIQMNGAEMPVLVKPEAREDFDYLIMPMSK